MDGQFTAQAQASGAETDHLAASVLRSLGRSFHNQFSLSPGRTFVMGWLTFGIWPIWKLSRQFSDYVAFERQQLWHLAEWVRLRRGGDESLALHASIDALRPSALVRLASMAGVGAFVLMILMELRGGFSIRELIDLTYGHQQVPATRHLLWGTWVIGLGLAYFMQVLQIAWHAGQLRIVAERFNVIATREGLRPIAVDGFQLGTRGMWITGCVVLSWLGAFWSIPMAFAASSQRRYINVTSTNLRAGLLERARAMQQQERPGVPTPRYVIHGRRCENSQCRAALRAGARFCVRCGASSGLISEVA